MDLKCNDVGCNNVYEVDVSGVGMGFVGMVGVMWKCNVCGRWNLYCKDAVHDIEVSI